MQIVRFPERDQPSPGGLLVFLNRHPTFLFVAWKDQIVFQLHFHESPVVIRRRIDQVTDDFFCRPLTGGWMALALSL